MRVRRISFLGVRTDNFDEMTAFVRDVLGMKPSPVQDGWAIFPLESSSRDFVEVYGPANSDERLLPLGIEAPIAALAVDDLLGARSELEAAGTEIIGDVVWASEAFDDPALEGFGWLFFRAPDGNVYVLQQERRYLQVADAVLVPQTRAER
ncbi:MAG: VOC family protein [Thermoplasmata archaeon]|nr:VOC family protein [Thermoplasmata archaeon]